jgi:hypothetical protein
MLCSSASEQAPPDTATITRSPLLSVDLANRALRTTDAARQSAHIGSRCRTATCGGGGGGGRRSGGWRRSAIGPRRRRQAEAVAAARAAVQLPAAAAPHLPRCRLALHAGGPRGARLRDGRIGPAAAGSAAIDAAAGGARRAALPAALPAAAPAIAGAAGALLLLLLLPLPLLLLLQLQGLQVIFGETAAPAHPDRVELPGCTAADSWSCVGRKEDHQHDRWRACGVCSPAWRCRLAVVPRRRRAGTASRGPSASQEGTSTQAPSGAH